MELAGKRAGEVLNMIAAVTDQGYEPARTEVDSYGLNPDRLLREYDPYTDEMYDMWDEEAYSTYLLRLNWIQVHDDRVTLSPLGQAILKALQDEGRFESVSVLQTVLGRSDPFAYARAMAVLAGVENALVVDPYLKLPDLIRIMPLANVTRVLTSDERKDFSLKAGPFAAASEATEGIREIRMATTALLQDRYFIPTVGPVMSLSTSMNSIGKRIGVISPLGTAASAAVREEHEAIWREAISIGPAQAAPVEV